MESTTSSLRALTTQSLLGHAREGNNSAWKLILLRYKMTLMVDARRKLPSLEEAEDVVQNAFMHAVSTIRNFEYREEGAFRKFLRSTVTNRCIDLARARREQESVEILHVPDPKCEQVSPSEFTEVVDAIEALPAPLGDIVLMRKYESKPWSEVAELVGTSEGAVRRKYVEAIGILQRQLS